MPLDMCRDEHAAVVDADEAVGDGHLDGLTSQPHPDRVQLSGEADLAGLADPAGRGRLGGAVREPPHWDATDRHRRTCALDGCAGVGPLGSASNRPIDRHDESVGHMRITLAIPVRSFSDLDTNAAGEPERSTHSTL